MIDKRDKILLVVILSFICIAFSLIIPAWQTPDEYAHLQMIGESIGQKNLAEEVHNNLGLDNTRVAFHKEEKISYEYYKTLMTKKNNVSLLDKKELKIKASIIKRAPATIGVLIAVALNLPSFWVVSLGELFAGAFYIICSVLALQIIPLKKDILTLIILLPMSIQSATSLSYDAVLLPLIYLYISFLMRLYFKKDKISYKEIIGLLILIAIIGYIKIPYIMLVLLLLILPQDRIKSNIIKILLKKRYLVVCGLGIVAVAMLFLMKSNPMANIMLCLILDINRTFFLVIKTLHTFSESLIISFVGNYGWLDTPVVATVAYMYLAFLILVSLGIDYYKLEKDYIVKKHDKMFIVFTAAVTGVLVMLSMVHHTIMIVVFNGGNVPLNSNFDLLINEIPYIGGLQGRYFIPVAAIAFLAVPERLITSNEEKKYVITFFVSLLYIYSIYIIINRFWT